VQGPRVFDPGFKHEAPGMRHTPRMRMIHLAGLLILMASVSVGAEKQSEVPLRLGGQTMLHVGQVGVLQLSVNHSYSVRVAGDAVRSVEQTEGASKYSFRAVRAGKASVLITPTDRKRGDCVDCVTRHCFLTVVP